MAIEFTDDGSAGSSCEAYVTIGPKRETCHTEIGRCIKVNSIAIQNELGYNIERRAGHCVQISGAAETTVVNDIIVQVGRTGR